MSNDQPSLKKIMLSRVGLFVLIFMVLFFIPAGTLAYWQAWMYLFLLLIPLGFAMVYFYKNNPDFLKRRMNYQESRKSQKKIVAFVGLIVLLAFILPGFDVRWGWSNVPAWLSITAEVVTLSGYILIIRVLLENQYASRVVEVTGEQKVITTGPYALVRHPMYVGVIFFYILSPLALGSYWGMIPAVLIIPMLVWRIKDEEALLHQELPSYTEFTQKVRYRLIPGIW